MDLKEIGINTRNWVDSAQDRDYWRTLVNAALNLRVPCATELVYVVALRKALVVGYIEPFNKHVQGVD